MTTPKTTLQLRPSYNSPAYQQMNSISNTRPADHGSCRDYGTFTANGKTYRVTLYRERKEENEEETPLVFSASVWRSIENTIKGIYESAGSEMHHPSQTLNFLDGQIYRREQDPINHYLPLLNENRRFFQNISTQAIAPSLSSSMVKQANHSTGHQRTRSIDLEESDWKNAFLNRLRNQVQMTVNDAAIMAETLKNKYSDCDFHVCPTTYPAYLNRVRNGDIRDSLGSYLTRDIPKDSMADPSALKKHFVIYPTGTHFIIFYFNYQTKQMEYYDPKGLVDRPIDPNSLKLNHHQLQQIYLDAFGNTPKREQLVYFIEGVEKSPQRHDSYNCLPFCYDFANRRAHGDKYSDIYQDQQIIANQDRQQAIAKWSQIRNEIANEIEPNIQGISF